MKNPAYVTCVGISFLVVNSVNTNIHTVGNVGFTKVKEKGLLTFSGKKKQNEKKQVIMFTTYNAT